MDTVELGQRVVNPVGTESHQPSRTARTESR
jgi:hypothetical protein